MSALLLAIEAYAAVCLLIAFGGIGSKMQDHPEKAKQKVKR